MGSGERFWHFDDATLPPEWSSIVGGNASVFMYDSGAKLDSGSGAAADSAAITMPFDRTLGRYQRITVCLRSDASAFRPQVALLYQVGGPTPDTAANVNGRLLCRSYTYSNAGLYYGSLTYWNTGGTANNWSDASKAWTTSNVGSTPQLSEADDYHIVGLDWDDVLDRVRLFWVHVATGTAFTSEAAGPKLFALTDWVDLATIRNGSATSDLHLVIGWLYNSVDLAGATQHIEWVRHEWADELEYLFTNQKSVGSSTYTIKGWSGLAGGTWLPVSRTGLAVDVAAATWKANTVHFHGAVYDPVSGLYWMAHDGSDGTVRGIGLVSASSPTAEPWTNYASNPVIGQEPGTHRGSPQICTLTCDYTDPDPQRRWKLCVTYNSDVDNKSRVYLWTAPQPDTTSWTLDGLLLDYEVSESTDGPLLNAPPVYLNGSWRLYYTIDAATNPPRNFVARSRELRAGTFVKDAALSYLPRSAGVEMTITSASSTSRVVDVTSTTGVQRDQLVCYDQDSTSDNFRYGRVRKVVSATQLELYHRMPGISTSGVLRTMNHGVSYPTHIRPRGDRWEWRGTMFAAMRFHATFVANIETSALWWATNPDREDPVADWPRCPGPYLGRDNNSGSSENPTYADRPVHPYTQPLTVRRRRRKTHLRR